VHAVNFLVVTFYDILVYLVLRLLWCPGQNKRIAPLSFLYGSRINSTYTCDRLQ
jgi:hypothetical protein